MKWSQNIPSYGRNATKLSKAGLNRLFTNPNFHLSTDKVLEMFDILNK